MPTEYGPRRAVPSHDGPPCGAPEARDLIALLDVIPTGVVLVDAGGQVVHVNGVATMRLGRAEADIVGLDLFREVCSELEEAGLGEQFRVGMRSGAFRFDWDGTLRTPGGEVRLWMGMRSLRLRDNLWGLLVLEDRSELAEEEERRRRAERLGAVGELAASVAHEVNNPLATIKSFAQLLTREISSPEHRRALEIIVAEASRIAGVVENLIRFARQQGVSGRELVDLSGEVEQIVRRRRSSFEAGGIEVKLDRGRLRSTVMGELGALQQVILNLIVSAERALARQTGRRLLLIRTRESSDGVVLSITDNGPGIPPERLSILFDGFRPEEEGQMDPDLAIAAQIVREHGGQLVAESEEGRGTTFTLRLPRSEDPGDLTEEPAPPQRPSPTRSLRILLADDEPTLRLAIALFLERRGHEVVQAPDAYEALRLARAEHFDVALVDARMPGDGLRLLEELESMPMLQGRTALMTGDLGRARTSQGVTTERPYLIKPFDMLDAVSLIEKLGR